MADDEFEPYVVLRLNGDQVECALGALASGERALNLFLTSESADLFRARGDLSLEWRALKPSKEDLLEILRRSVAGGIPYAILEPAAAEPKIFDLQQVLAAAASSAS